MKTALHGGIIERAVLPSSAALFLALSGCASQRVDARSTPTSTTTARAPAPANGLIASQDREATVQISKAMRERCKIEDLPQEAPRFDYDRAALHALGRNVLDDVANCLLDGPLSGEVVTLVGRADVRGSADYNEDLGRSRAAAARDYLALRGVPVDRIRMISRGEQGARGNDEASFALDRRVDVELGDLKTSPILQGSMIQAETSRRRVPTPSEAASYADTAEGAKPVGASGSDSNDASSGATESRTSGSASGSVKASVGGK
jgi:outer membrane protein OmpA-like peptidoglycan-associated protein